MSFRVNNKQFFEDYSKIWEKVEKLMRIWKVNLFMVMIINTYKQK